MFNNEDPQECCTLRIFLHRRKAELTISSSKIHMFIDSQENVTAHYQWINPSKRDVWCLDALNKHGPLYQKVQRDEVGTQLQYIMSVLNFPSVGLCVAAVAQHVQSKLIINKSSYWYESNKA